MTPEEKKEFILNVVKSKGYCYDRGPGVRCYENYCVLTEKYGCFGPKDAYKMAIDWAITYCKEDLLERLI